MPKVARIDLSKGVNSRIDKAIAGSGYVSIADNCDLRSGFPRPFKFPSYEKDATSTSTCIWKYHGKWYESDAHRDYVGEIINGKDVVYFTEAGVRPKMIVEGSPTVDMGVDEPQVAPIVNKGSNTFPTVSIAETGGNFAKNRVVSYRVAWQTKDGIQPPSPKAIGTASDNGKGFVLTWNANQEAIAVLIFAGTPDNELLLTTLSGSSITYTDTGAVEATGFTAASYDDKTPYTYVYTFVRDVNGIVEESGPSPVSTTVDSTTGRSIGFDYDNDGQFSSQITLNTSNIVVSPAAVTISAASLNTATRQVKFTTSTNHGFSTGNKVTFAGFSTPAEPKISVSSVIESKPLSVRFTLASAHGYVAGQKLLFEGFNDSAWNGKEFSITAVGPDTFYVLGNKAPVGALGTVTKAAASSSTNLSGTYEVVADYSDPKIFYVSGIEAPTGTLGTARLNKTQFDTSGTHNAVDGDAVYVVGTGALGGSISGIYQVHVVGSNTIWIDLLSDAGAAITTAKFATNKLAYRNLYRTGNSGGYFLVKQLKMWEVSYTDILTVENLGEAATTFYTENGQNIIFKKPPLGAQGICSHYGMKFMIDGNNVIWNVPGFAGSYSAQFYQSFDYKPVALASFAQGLIVLCPDGIYRLDGTQPTQMTLTRTHAENGCIAAKSVQRTHAGLIYLAKRGLMLFDGMNAQCITDQKLPDNFLIAPSNMGDGTTWNFWMLPTRFSYNYAALTVGDGWSPVDTKSVILHYTVPIDGINQAVDSFYWDGRYFLFWNNSRDYGAHTTVVVDLQVQGFPISSMGMQIVDATVDEFEDAWVLLANSAITANDTTNINQYIADQMIPGSAPGTYFSNVGKTIRKFNGDNMKIPYLIRTGQNSFGGEYERKSFKHFEIHSVPSSDSSSYFRVFIDGNYSCESLITPSEQPAKIRKMNIPRSAALGYASDVEFSGTMNVRAIEFTFNQRGES